MNEQSSILTMKDVLHLTRRSRTNLYTVLMPKLGFPKPFKLGQKNNAWLRADVEAWIVSRVNA